MGQTKDSWTQNLNPDRAAESIDEDLLSWKGHVDRLVDAIVRPPSIHSFVVGVRGGWGTGKSTLLNLVREKLKKNHANDITIFEYSPWLSPGEDHVVNFFDELEKTVRRLSHRDQNRKLTQLINRYRRMAAAASATASGLSAAGRLASLAMWILGAGTSALSYWHGWYWFAVGIIVLICVTMGWRRILLASAEYMDQKREAGEVTLAQLKRDLYKDVEKNQQRILIIIDDIDRLSPPEICQIFQIVKNNGDLPNLTYLLAFDDEVVSQVLAKEYSEQYKGFTEKIVQLPFTIPYPERVFLEHYVSQKVVEIADSYSEAVQDRWSRSRWINRNHFYFRHIYRTLRDVKRILNGFYLDSQAVLGSEIPEVDPVDFFSIALVRVRFPELHGFIRDNKALFTYERESTTLFASSQGKAQQSLDSYQQALKDFVGQQYRAKVDALLTDIFPKIQALKEENIDHHGQEAEWSKNLYVCAKDFFDRYFQYGTTGGDIPNAVIAAVLRVVHQPKEAVGLLESYHHKPELLVAIDRVLSHVGDQRMPSSLTESDWLGFLFEVGDYLPQDQGDMLGTSDPVYTIMSQFRAITERRNPELALNVIMSALARSTGVFGPVVVVGNLTSTDTSEDSTETVRGHHLEDLRDQVSARVRNRLKDETLLKYQHFVLILLQQKEWVGDTVIRNEIKVLTKEDTNFKTFITRFLTRVEPLKIGAKAGPIGYRYGFGRLKNFMDLREAHMRVRATHVDENDSIETRGTWEVFLRDYDDYNSDPNGYSRRHPPPVIQ